MQGDDGCHLPDLEGENLHQIIASKQPLTLLQKCNIMAQVLAARHPGPVPLTLTATRRSPVSCPHCGSPRTAQTAAFSGTACKALYRCESCREPFEYVKEI